jgi:hypothetical protein
MTLQCGVGRTFFSALAPDKRNRAVLNNQTQNFQSRLRNISLVPTNESELDRQSHSGRRGNLHLIFVPGGIQGRRFEQPRLLKTVMSAKSGASLLRDGIGCAMTEFTRLLARILVPNCGDVNYGCRATECSTTFGRRSAEVRISVHSIFVSVLHCVYPQS